MYIKATVKNYSHKKEMITMYGLPDFHIVIFTVLASIPSVCLGVIFFISVYFFYRHLKSRR